jgi:hypothetical protein
MENLDFIMKNIFFTGFLGFFVSINSFAAGPPTSQHVWIITEENLSYDHVIGSSACPYINGLANKYGLATAAYSEQHSSLPALMWLVAGAGSAITTNNDIDPTTMSACFKQETVLRPLIKAGYKWRAYMEGLPSPGYQDLYGGPGNNYYRRHNPLIDFTDACVGSGQEDNSVPLTQMAADFAKGYTTNYAYISPSAIDDMHSGTPAAADAWLAKYVPTILARPEFQSGGDGILFITFDEGDLYDDNSSSPTDLSGGGGHIMMLVIGPQVKPQYRSTTLYHNASILATTCAAMGLSPCPGAGATAPVMSEFFGASATTSSGVTIHSPLTGDNLVNPVPISASSKESVTVKSMQILANGKVLGTYSGTSVDQTLTLPVGSDVTLTVQDLGSDGKVIHSSSVSVNVSNTSASTDGITIYSPSNTAANNGGSLPNPILFNATAVEKESVNQMQIWDNGTKLAYVEGNGVNLSFTLSAGAHTSTIIAVDTSGTEIDHSTVSYTVAGETNGVSISSPVPGTTISGAVNVVANAVETSSVTQMQAWDNGVKLGYASGSSINQSYTLTPGSHVLTVLAQNGSSILDHGTVAYTVAGVEISSLSEGQTVSGAVTVDATAYESASVSQIQVWDNGVKLGSYSGSSITQTFSLSHGAHRIGVIAADSGGNAINKSVVNITVD